MFEKEKGLFDAFVAKKMSRRELIQGAGKLGLTASAAGVFLTQAQTRAMAADFDWMKYKGSNLALNSLTKTCACVKKHLLRVYRLLWMLWMHSFMSLV